MTRYAMGSRFHPGDTTSPVLGVGGEFSYFQNNSTLSVFLHQTDQIMGGIKLQDNTGTIRFRPFAHALIGVAHTSNPRVLRRDIISGTVA
jgi:hypothetical protein